MRRKIYQKRSRNDCEESLKDENSLKRVDLAIKDSMVNNRSKSYEEIVEGSEGNFDLSGSDSDENVSDAKDNDDFNARPKHHEEIKNMVLQRYQKCRGKQLYIRFPHKVPETQELLEAKIKGICPLVVKVHKPRQRHARFCLADFATKDDRDTTLRNLKKAIKKGELSKYVVNIPRTESVDFVEELVKRKIKSIENKKAKARLKRASKKAMREKLFTSTLVVLNLPKTASVLQIRELFTNAVDIQLKPGKGKFNKNKAIAAVTLPTTMDAKKAVKSNMSLGGNRLIIKFDNQNIQKYTKLKRERLLKSISNTK